MANTNQNYVEKNYTDRETYSTPSYETTRTTYNSSTPNYGPIITAIVLTGLATLLWTWLLLKNFVPQSQTIIKPVEIRVTEWSGTKVVNYPINNSLDYEILRAGWVDNFNKLNALYGLPEYKKYMSDQTDQMITSAKQAMGITDTWTSASAWTTTSTASTASTVAAVADDFARWSLTDDQLNQLKSHARWVKWDANSQILWFEFSDVECPFCKKLHQQGTVKDILAQFDGKIAFTMMHFPLTQIHTTAQKGSETLECVYEMYKDKYASFKESVYAMDLSTKPTWETLSAMITTQGMDANKIKTCVDSGKYASEVQAQMDLGSKLFGIQWTPGNVLVNATTKKYVVISGAYPTSNFQNVINELLK